MIDFEHLNKTDLLQPELYDEVMGEEDELEREFLIAKLESRAKELGQLRPTQRLIKNYRIKFDERVKESTVEGLTNFRFPEKSEYQQLNCGEWIASDKEGVYQSVASYPFKIIACPHPIILTKRMVNQETMEEQITIAFKRNHRWKEMTVSKALIASQSSIVALARNGVAVTSENAKALVRYLSDLETKNEDFIEVVESSWRLGWHGKDFLPYDQTGVVFDGESKFRRVVEAVKEHGSYETWLDTVRRIRMEKRVESRFLLAASFASVLVKPLGVLPFFVDLWGETEGGKSVSLMLACSVWANPDESRYIGNYKTTDTALEVLADMLNSLPVLLDDTSNANQKIMDNYESIIYTLCNGQGKSRSNKGLGINYENHWSNCFITNGEKPLTSYVKQGGAFNRVLEVEAQMDIFEDPALVATRLKQNYGYAGAKFVEVIKDLGKDELLSEYNDVLQELTDSGKMQKQTQALAVVVLADRLIEEFIFQDNILLTSSELKGILMDKEEVSDNQRCLEYIIDKVAMNSGRFDATAGIEKWGWIDKGVIYFYPQALTQLLKEADFSRPAFLSWAKKRGYLETDHGRYRKSVSVNGSVIRSIAIKPPESDFIEEEENPFD